MPPSGDDRRALQAAASVAVSAALLAWVLGRIDQRALWAELGALDVGWLLLAAALGPLQVALAAERWRVACERLGQPFGRPRALREMALGTLLNQLLPGGIAGDAVRAWRTPRDPAAGAPGVGLGASVRAVVVDRIVGLGVTLGAVALGIGLWLRLHPEPPPRGTGALVLAVAVGLTGIAAAPRRVPVLGRIGGDLRAVLGHPGTVLRMLALSATMTASFLLGFALCGRAVGASLGAGAVTAMPLVLLSMSVPVGFAGWGLREVTAAAVLPRLGLSAESAVALSACYGLSVLLGALPGAVVPLLPGDR